MQLVKEMGGVGMERIHLAQEGIRSAVCECCSTQGTELLNPLRTKRICVI